MKYNNFARVIVLLMVCVTALAVIGKANGFAPIKISLPGLSAYPDVTPVPDIYDEYMPMELDLPPVIDEIYDVVDLSFWNDDVDFDILAENGIKGVILRLSRYNMDLDERFPIYYKQAKEHGMLVGCYYFMHALTVDDALNDVDRIIGFLNEGGYVLDLPVFYDVEDEHDSGPEISEMGRDELTLIMLAFLSEMNERGVYAGYYSGAYLAKKSYWPDMLLDYPYWGAAWKSELTREQYKNLCVWQYTSTGTFEGMDGNFDISHVLVDFVSYYNDNDLKHEEGIY